MPEKDAFIPKTKVEQERRDRYDHALQARRDAGERDLSFSDWLRRACDAQADRDLGEG